MDSHLRVTSSDEHHVIPVLIALAVIFGVVCGLACITGVIAQRIANVEATVEEMEQDAADIETCRASTTNILSTKRDVPNIRIHESHSDSALYDAAFRSGEIRYTWQLKPTASIRRRFKKSE